MTSSGSGILQHTNGRLDVLASFHPQILDCEACGSEGTMTLRRSSLRPSPCADDVTLKCTRCFHVRTHGIPITRAQYETELVQRGEQRVHDAVMDGGEDGLQERLAALGYLEP